MRRNDVIHLACVCREQKKKGKKPVRKELFSNIQHLVDLGEGPGAHSPPHSGLKKKENCKRKKSRQGE